MEINKLAAKVVAELKDGADIVAGIKAVKEAWASESNVLKKAFKAVSAAVSVITDVVQRVETLGADLKLAGAQKKELAVAVINFMLVRMAPGDPVTLTVPHCDPTVNLYDHYHVVAGDTLVAIWPVSARGRAR